MNSDTVPARVGIRSTWLRYGPAAAGGGLVLAVLFGVLLSQRAPDHQPVQDGRRFSAAERRNAADTLRNAGIDSSTAPAGQLLVSPADLAASNAALQQVAVADEDNAPSTGRSWLDAFSTSRQQQAVAESKDAARLGRLLEELPGVQSAEVVWDEEPRSGRRQAPRVRATVFLKPETGCVLGLDTVHAVRAAVAGSRAYLAAHDVAVMDLERHVTHGTQSDPAAFAAEVRRAELIAACRSRIEAAFADLAGVRIALDLEVPTALDASPQPDSNSASAEPARLPSRVRFAGVSGPNLRLEIPREPPQWTTAEDRTNRLFAATLVQLPQLAVSIVLPGKASESHNSLGDRQPSRRPEPALGTADIQRRIASAVAGLPVALAPARLNITVLPAETHTTELVQPGNDAQRFAGGWTILARLAAMPLVQHTAAAVLATSLLLLVARRLWRRQRSSLPSPRAVARRRATGRSASRVEFLPGVSAATWAPLVAREPSPIVAGLLRHLSADDVSQVLAELTPARQGEVLELAPTAEMSMAQLDDTRHRIRAGLAMVAPTDAPRPSATQSAARPRSAPHSAAAVFDDLFALNDETLRELAARVHDATWSAAAMGAAPRLQRRMSEVRILTGAPPDGAERRPMRLREIESAQRTILDAWQTLQVGS